jgi:hypothetical protein
LEGLEVGGVGGLRWKVERVEKLKVEGVEKLRVEEIQFYFDDV